MEGKSQNKFHFKYEKIQFLRVGPKELFRQCGKKAINWLDEFQFGVTDHRGAFLTTDLCLLYIDCHIFI